MRVLVVASEDNAVDAARLAVRRRRAGVEWTTHGEAVNVLAVGVDLVIVDFGLRGSDPREVCRRLRRASPVPLLALVDPRDVGDTRALSGLGVDDYLVKPVHSLQLRARIDAVLDGIRPVPPPPPAAPLPLQRPTAR